MKIIRRGPAEAANHVGMIKMLTWLKSLARSESKPDAGPPLRADVASAELLQFHDNRCGYAFQYSASIELDASEETRRRASEGRCDATLGLQWIMHRWIDKANEELAWRMHLMVYPVTPDMADLPALAHLVKLRQQIPPALQVTEEPRFSVNLPGMSSFAYVSLESGLQTQVYACLDPTQERLFVFTALAHSQVYPVARGKWEKVLETLQFSD